MSLIVDMYVFGFEQASPPDAWNIAFDVIYPEETWCRSLVRVAAEVASGSEQEITSWARDCLLALLEEEGEPASADIRLTSRGVELLALGYPPR